MVADQERIVWGDTFQESMEALIETTIGPAPGYSTRTSAAPARDIAETLLRLQAALDRYKTLQGEGRFSEAGSELEEIYRMVESLISSD